jgi:FkbM family methyltransferase
MSFAGLIDRIYSMLARSRWVVRAAVHGRGIASAVIAKRLAPTTLPDRNGEIELLSRLSGEARVVVDVGANVGDWSATVIQTCPRLERLICFEPAESAADQLVRRVGGDTRVTIVRSPLSDTSATLTFWEEPDGGTMSSGVEGHSGSAAIQRTLQATTLDDELERLDIERIDILKIDAEGLDLHVLRGASRMLKAQSVDVVQFEYSVGWQAAGSTLRAAYSLLADAGYRTLLVTPHGLREYPIAAITELYAYANFVALLPRQLARFEPIEQIW